MDSSSLSTEFYSQFLKMFIVQFGSKEDERWRERKRWMDKKGKAVAKGSCDTCKTRDVTPQGTARNASICLSPFLFYLLVVPAPSRPHIMTPPGAFTASTSSGRPLTFIIRSTMD